MPRVSEGEQDEAQRGRRGGRRTLSVFTGVCSCVVGPLECGGGDLSIIDFVGLHVFPEQDSRMYACMHEQDSTMYASTRQKELHSTCLYALHHSTGMYMHPSQGVMRAFPREYSCKYRKWSGAFGCRVWGVGTRYPNKSDIVSHLFSELRLYLAVLAASFHRAYSSAAYFAPA